MKLIVDWRGRVKRSQGDDLMFSTWSDPNCSLLFTNRRKERASLSLGSGSPSRSSQVVRSSKWSDFARFASYVETAFA